MSFRLITRIDVKNGFAVKGRQFEGLRVLGPLDLTPVVISQSCGVEIYLYDVVASLYRRKFDEEILDCLSGLFHVPVTVEGNVRSIADCERLFASGADRIGLNSGLHDEPDLLARLVDNYGDTAIIPSFHGQYIGGEWFNYSLGGRENTGQTLSDFIKLARRSGVAEVHICSIRRDGTNKGPDLELLEIVSSESGLGVVFGGGISTVRDVNAVSSQSCCRGVVIGRSLLESTLNPVGLVKYIDECCNN